MPHLGIERSNFIVASKLGGWRNFDYAFKKSFGAEVLGDGGEYFVVPLPNHPDKVQAIQWLSDYPIKEARISFYWHRLFSTLFPHNIPHMHAIFGNEDPQAFTGQIRQRITGLRGDEPYSPYKAALQSKGRKFDWVKRECSRWQLPLIHDTYSSNFITTPNGDEYYVDSLEYRYDLDKLDNFLNYALDNNYSQKDLTIIQRSIARIKTISSQSN